MLFYQLLIDKLEYYTKLAISNLFGLVCQLQKKSRSNLSILLQLLPMIIKIFNLEELHISNF